MFSSEYCGIFKNGYFCRTPLVAAAVNEPYTKYDCQLATTNGGGNYAIETHKTSRSRYNTFKRVICCTFLDYFMLLVSFYTP